MKNLDKVKDNLVTIKKHFDFLGIKDLTILENSSHDAMTTAYKEIRKKCEQADEFGSKTKLLVYVYAATHGVMYNGATKTQIVLM